MFVILHNWLISNNELNVHSPTIKIPVEKENWIYLAICIVCYLTSCDLAVNITDPLGFFL
jgi:TRAP-type C4-dicarboxylate transport system permease small subunit